MGGNYSLGDNSSNTSEVGQQNQRHLRSWMGGEEGGKERGETIHLCKVFFVCLEQPAFLLD